MKEWLLARGFPEIVVNNQIDKAVFGRGQSVKKNLESGIPFVTTYHPKVNEFGKLIQDILPILYSVREVQKVFSSPPIVSSRSARKIKDYIVTSKLYPDVRKRISITEEFTSFTTKKTYKITIVLIAMINV